MAARPAEPGVTVLYGGMYRNTERALDFALQAVAEQGVPLEVFNVAVTDPNFILPSLWTDAACWLPCPTYERAMFPPMVHALNIAGLKGVRNANCRLFRLVRLVWRSESCL